MHMRRQLLASSLLMSLGMFAPWLSNPIRVVDRPRAVPPTRSRQRAKGMRFSGGTGELRARRSTEDQVRRNEAAQAKRERRWARNLRIAAQQAAA